jgi:ABC-type transporter Mla subunit MlaD
MTIVVALALAAWTVFRDRREARTLVLSFHNIDGLTKGAPVFVHGVKVGKVIQLTPLLNTNAISVKVLITDKNMPVPDYAEARIITSIETGGGKVIELQNLTRSIESKRLSMESVAPITAAYMGRLMLDMFQMTKDFAIESMHAMNTPQADNFKTDLENQVKNAITSVEYGTVKKDVENEVLTLNRQIRNTELDPTKNDDMSKAIKNQAKALDNTIKSLSNVSDVYKQQYNPKK